MKTKKKQVKKVISLRERNEQKEKVSRDTLIQLVLENTKSF